MRAVVVLPTPRTPVRIQACGMRPVSNAFEMVRTIASWPIRSSKVDGAVFAREHAIARRRRGGGSGWRVGVLFLAVAHRAHPIRNARTVVDADHDEGGRLTSDPIRCSLGLLPSGPDPVGEWLVHRQPPGVYIGRRKAKASAAAVHSSVAAAADMHHGCPKIARMSPGTRNCACVTRPATQQATPCTVGDLPLSRVSCSMTTRIIRG